MARETSGIRISGTGARRSPAEEPEESLEESLELGILQEPDDQGLSLEELGQTYAALMEKGADPYPQPNEEAVAEEEEPSADEPLSIIEGEDELTCEVTPLTILEAILFVGRPGDDPLTSEQIAGLMRGVRPAEVDEMVAELNAAYATERCPYEIQSVGAGYKLVLRTEFAPLRDAFYGRIREARLSQSAVDVLAVVAYHQPVTQEEIDRVRGKPSGGILSQLVRRDLLSVERPPEKKAKPLYRTTDRFLGLFGLADLSELPRSQEDGRES